MTSADRRLEKILCGLINYTAKVRGHDVPYPNIGLLDYHSAIDALRQRDLALLSNIKENGPEDMIAHSKNDGQPRLYYRQVGFNSSNKIWRTKLDNIAKEIRGEGHE